METKQFVSALKTASLAIDSRSVIPAMECAWVRHGKMIGSNFDQTIAVDVPGLEDFAIPHPRKIAKVLSGEQVDVVVNGATTIKTETMSLSLDFRDDFPPPITLGEPTFKAELDDAFLRALRRVAVAVTNETTRFYLHGVCLQHADAGLRLVATDGYRMHIGYVPLPQSEGALEPNTILPSGAVPMLLALARGAVTLSLHRRLSDNHPQSQWTGKTHARIAVDGATLDSALIDGTYPDINRLIPAKTPFHATVDRKALLAATRIAQIEKGRPVFRLDFDGGKLTISRRWMYGDARAHVDVSTNFENFTIGVNGSYLREALTAHTGDYVTLAFATSDRAPSATSPFKLADPDDDAFEAVIMPMRL